MATCKDCKDCLHYELCGVFDYISPDECGFYTARSRFVELPCKVYTTFLGRVVEAKICGYEASMKNSNYNWVIEPQHFGKYVFFTYEEAEQALKKERKDNA